MWVTTQDGDLINLDAIARCAVVDKCIVAWERGSGTPTTLMACKSKGNAQKALDRLQKWINLQGYATGDLKPVPDTVTAHGFSGVFSFRTLSHDDEF